MIHWQGQEHNLHFLVCRMTRVKDLLRGFFLMHLSFAWSCVSTVSFVLSLYEQRQLARWRGLSAAAGSLPEEWTA